MTIPTLLDPSNCTVVLIDPYAKAMLGEAATEGKPYAPRRVTPIVNVH
jgi:hypothetical protein